MGKKTRANQQAARKGTRWSNLALALSLIAGSGVAAHVYMHRYQPRADYRTNQDRIDIGNVSDQLFNPAVTTSARDAMWKVIPIERPEFADTTEIKFDTLTSQSFSIPLDQRFDSSPARALHDQAMQELAALGFPEGFTLKPVYSIQDIDLRDPKRVTYLVGKLGNLFRTHVQLVRPSGAVPLSFNYENSEGGNVDGVVAITSDIVTCTRGDCRVSVTQQRIAGVLSSLFTEPLHYELMPARTDLAQKLISRGHNVALGAATVTDEAVVHGVFQDYLRENHARLGYTIDALAQESADKSKRFTYLGASVIADRCQERGRLAVIQEYQASPDSIWNLLREQIPAFQTDIR